MNNPITVETIIEEKVENIWKYWSEPQHIKKWNNASVDWHTPKVENDLRTDGKFIYRMEAKDGSVGFDFAGTYTDVKENNAINYKLDDGRKVKIEFKQAEGSVKIVETFEPENQNSIDMQKEGWQAILNNFKKYVETQSGQ